MVSYIGCELAWSVEFNWINLAYSVDVVGVRMMGIVLYGTNFMSRAVLFSKVHTKPAHTRIAFFYVVLKGASTGR